jgi:hypothetical protein
MGRGERRAGAGGRIDVVSDSRNKGSIHGVWAALLRQSRVVVFVMERAGSCGAPVDSRRRWKWMEWST